jgi:hypothetical protein
MHHPNRRLLPLLTLLLVLAVVPAARATELTDESGASWQVEQPAPPPPEQPGVEPSSVPVSLGHIGDIEFYEPNRGVLITSGNGSSVPPGVWFYNGVVWRELSNQCGATDGRIAWAGPDEFWTASDGRPGQAPPAGQQPPPREDNTLCHFAPGANGRIAIVGSYASVAFEASSYLPMHGAGCLTASDCWFAGDPLAEPETGAFQLHWNGHTLAAEPYLPEGHTVSGMRRYEGKLFESVKLAPGDRVAKAVFRPAPLRGINSEGTEKLFEPITGLPPYLYAGSGEFSTALDYLRLGTGGESLWAAGGPVAETPAGSEKAGVTVIRHQSGVGWSSVVSSGQGKTMFPGEVVKTVAGEAEGSSAWLGLDTEQDVASPSALARAHVVRLTSEGATSDDELLPEPGDPHGPLGAVSQIVCPAAHDCWMTTNGGWLLHLATAAERKSPQTESDAVFREEGGLITFRPPDEGVPQEPSDELPADISGNETEGSREKSIPNTTPKQARETVPLVSGVHEKLVHRTTLELSFRLAVKAHVRLLAERGHRVIASTPQRTLRAGKRMLLLKLDPKHWPSKLNLQTKALAPLPTRPAARGLNTITTSFLAPATLISGAGFLP